MGTIALVALGGALGAVARLLISRALPGSLPGTIPWGTLAVNLLGSFLIGWLLASPTSRVAISPELKLLLVTGVLGGFTTYSAFNHETLMLWTGGLRMSAALYAGGTLVGAWLAGALGLWVGRGISG